MRCHQSMPLMVGIKFTLTIALVDRTYFVPRAMLAGLCE